LLIGYFTVLNNENQVFWFKGIYKKLGPLIRWLIKKN
jgi:hypothetical protein